MNMKIRKAKGETAKVSEDSQPLSPEQNKKNRRWPIFLLIFLSFAINAAAWGLIFWKLPPTEDIVFLHYNIFFGIDLAGDWHQLLWIPGSGLAAAILNTAVILLAKGMERFFKYLGLVITSIIQFIILLATVLVVLLNG